MQQQARLIEQRLQTINHVLGGIALTEGKETIDQAITQLNLVADTIRIAAQVETNAEETFIQQVLSDLARCKLKLSSVAHQLEELKTQAADRYRMELGDEKANFEKLSLIMQQQTNAAAFQHKSVFDELKLCLEEKAHLMGELMDLKSSIEHERFARLGIPTGDGAVIASTNDHGDRPTLSP
ncbi:hypothetical protein FHS18_005631 [Paenibacillus phyllosphaerae]|uniref:Uncharacterized protein n=1 Tax=Paenibacillus phyllosphaerae TaxID=274593 RepID=A0A7W5FQY9_9BACL|nr:hypothetical protein [Paenibacillus phyllosphaerae]MBB3113519.1 hypothetical protein [Paenibacillus phyllosphaerae]